MKFGFEVRQRQSRPPGRNDSRARLLKLLFISRPARHALKLCTTFWHWIDLDLAAPVWPPARPAPRQNLPRPCYSLKPVTFTYSMCVHLHVASEAQISSLLLHDSTARDHPNAAATDCAPHEDRTRSIGALDGRQSSAPPRHARTRHRGRWRGCARGWARRGRCSPRKRSDGWW